MMRRQDGLSPPLVWAWLVLGLALLAAAVQLPGRWPFDGADLELMRLWGQPEAQARRLLQGLPYDLLRRADAVLPRRAALLLVTSGDDVRHGEYTTWHRALYFLTPRPVWWLTAAPPDGTWESRWWFSAPPTPEAICALAAEKGVSFVLFYGVVPDALAGCAPGVPWQREAWEEGTLVSLADREPEGAAGWAGPNTVTEVPGWPVRLAMALLAIVALGWAVMGVLARGGRSCTGIERLALAWTLGAGLLSLLMAGLNALGLPFSAQKAVLAVPAIGLGGAALIRTGWNRRPDGPARGETGGKLSRLLTWLLLLCLVVQVVFVVSLAVARPLTVWDSWVTWGLKARTLFREDGISPAVYAEPSRNVTHLDYPLLLPLLQAWLYTWLGLPDDRLAGLVPVLCYLALVGICYAALRRQGAGRNLALAAVTAIAVSNHLAGLAGLAFADVPLALLSTVAAIYLVEWLAGGRPAVLAIAGLAAGLMPWTKREGWVLLAILTLAGPLVAWRSGDMAQRRRAWFGAGTLAAAGLLLAGPWWLFVAGQGFMSSDLLPPSLSTLWSNLDRLPAIARLEWANLWSPGWNLIWPLAAGFGLLAWRGGARLFLVGCRPLHLFAIVAAGYLALMSASYLLSAMVPYQQHVLSSNFRLAAHVAPLPALWVAGCGLAAARAKDGRP